jgi:uncharacterized membrane protein YeiB
MSETTPALLPLSESRRIDAMDILRGFALLGILLMNIEWFNRAVADIGTFDKELTGLDHAVGWLIRCFVEGKFYKLFALLFGMGFAVMLIRAKEAGRPFSAWFSRRMVVLFFIGLLHMFFLWGGDILHDYAFAGLVFLGWILLFRTRWLQKFNNPNQFLKIGLIWLVVPYVGVAIAGLVFGINIDATQLIERSQERQQIVAMADARLALPVIEVGDGDDAEADSEDDGEERELTKEEEIEQAVNERVERRRERDADSAEEVEAFTNGTYWEATKFRFQYGLMMLAFTPLFTFIMLIPIFLIGYWFVASGVVRKHAEYRHIFKPMAVIGWLFGLLFTVGGLTVMQHPAARGMISLQAAGQTLFAFGQFVLSAGYLGSIMLLLGKPKWHARLSRLAPIGRMALTNYIMHSVILALIFHGYAGGMFGEISRAPQMLIVVAILVFQFYFSTWWLKHYRFGPLEWVWRSLTYNSVQPMKIAA